MEAEMLSVEETLALPWTPEETVLFSKMQKIVAATMIKAKPELSQLSPNEILLRGVVEQADYMTGLVSPEVAADLAYVADTLENVSEVLQDLRVSRVIG